MLLLTVSTTVGHLPTASTPFRILLPTDLAAHLSKYPLLMLFPLSHGFLLHSGEILPSPHIAYIASANRIN